MTESGQFNEKMNGLKKENWTAIRDESGRSKRRVTSMLVKNVGDQESGPKWTVQKGDSGRSIKWTVVRKWIVLSQTGRSLEPKWTVLDDSGRSSEPK